MLDAVLELLPDGARRPHRPAARRGDGDRVEVLLEAAARHLADSYVLMIDPMLATGGSAVAAIDLIKAAGATHDPHDLHRRRAGRRGARRAAPPGRRGLHAGRRPRAQRAQVTSSPGSATSAIGCTERYRAHALADASPTVMGRGRTGQFRPAVARTPQRARSEFVVSKAASFGVQVRTAVERMLQRARSGIGQDLIRVLNSDSSAAFESPPSTPSGRVAQR